MLINLIFNAKVYSQDQSYLGRLIYVAVSKENGKLARLIVKKSIFNDEEKIVDLDSVATITGDGKTIRLKISAREYLDLPVLTIYEEGKAVSSEPLKTNPFDLNTRLVTYLPDGVMRKDVADPDNEQNEDSQGAGRFMGRIKIYTNQFVVLGGNSIFRIRDKAKTGILHHLNFNPGDGKIDSINLRQVNPHFSFSFTEFQVPFKLNDLNRLPKRSFKFE